MMDGRVRQLTAAVLVLVLLGIGIWLLSATPGTILDDGAERLGPTPQSAGTPTIIRVDAGESAGEIGEKLEDAGIIQSARLFKVLAGLMALGDSLEAGDYEFTRGETALTAVRRISQGRTAALSVTIREGLRLEEVAELLDDEGVTTAAEFLSALSEPYEASFLSALPEGTSFEGFLFPARYNLSLESGAHELVQRMLTAFDDRYLESVQEPLAASGLSLLEAVTLASIVEREAQVPEERPTIASIFLNRLAQGIALQADPTVQYAVAADPASVDEFGYWKRELTEADLALDSPYNTYVLPGLPPGPIANPGLDSILAAVQPAQTNYLYFVACQDGSGRHMFSETLEDHNANVFAADQGECQP